MGVKRDKAENAAERSAYKMAKLTDRVNVAIENSTKAKLLASSVAIQFKIIKSLPFGEEEKPSWRRQGPRKLGLPGATAGFVLGTQQRAARANGH